MTIQGVKITFYLIGDLHILYIFIYKKKWKSHNSNDVKKDTIVG